MSTNTPNANDLSFNMHQAMLDAWFQKNLPLLLSDPDEPNGSEDEEKARVN